MPEYFDLIPNSSPVDADVFNEQLLNLNDAIALMRAGGLGLTGFNLGNPSAVPLTIALGVVTKTRPVHTIDTEGGAAEDDLTQINGGIVGDYLMISIANASHVVVVRHGIGNIYLAGNLDKRLDSTRKIITLRCNGTGWDEISGQFTDALSYNGLRLPSGMPIGSALWGRNRINIKAAAATIFADGVATPTIVGTPAASNDTDSTYINIATGAVANNPAGFASTTYNVCRYSHNPTFSVILRSLALTDLANIRMWVGLTSAAPGNNDAVGGATEAALFRFHPGLGDTAWTPVVKDASTQNVGGGITAVAANSRYLLQVKMDYLNSRVIFMINNTAQAIMTTNLPAASTELGFNVIMYTTNGVTKNFKFSRAVLEYD